MKCAVDYERRSRIAPNHSLTHVLNFALRKVNFFFVKKTFLVIQKAFFGGETKVRSRPTTHVLNFALYKVFFLKKLLRPPQGVFTPKKQTNPRSDSTHINNNKSINKQ